MADEKILNKIEKYAELVVNLTGKNRLLKFPSRAKSVNFNYNVDDFQDSFLKNGYEELKIIFDHKLLDEAIDINEQIKNIEIQKNEENNVFTQKDLFDNKSLELFNQSSLEVLKNKLSTIDLPKIQSPLIQNVKSFLYTLKLDSKKKYDEKGIKSMFISVGSITWAEGYIESDKKEFDSALILIPVQIDIDNRNKKTIIMTDLGEREIVFNPVLDLYLRKQFRNTKSIKFDEEKNIKDNLMVILDSINDTFRSENVKYNYSETIRLCEYYFQSQYIFEELTTKQNYISENTITASILDTKDHIMEGPCENISEVELTRKIQENDLNVLNSDISQDYSINKALNQKVTIIQGPPGTGKSQTIVNLISNIIGSGKTILFICEKKAALEVVYSRLKKVHLDSLCLPLFNSEGSKKDFYSKLLENFNTVIKSRYRLNNTEKTERKIVSEKLHRYSEILSELITCVERPLYEIISDKAVLKNKHNYFEWDNSIKINNLSDFNFFVNFFDSYTKYFESISFDDYKKVSFIKKTFFTNNDESNISTLIDVLEKSIEYLNHKKFKKVFTNTSNIKDLVIISKMIDTDILSSYRNFKNIKDLYEGVKKTDFVFEYSDLKNNIGMYPFLDDNSTFIKFESNKNNNILTKITFSEETEFELKNTFKKIEDFTNNYRNLDESISRLVNLKEYQKHSNLLKHINNRIDIHDVLKNKDAKVVFEENSTILKNQKYLNDLKDEFYNDFKCNIDEIPEFIENNISEVSKFSVIKYFLNKIYRAKVSQIQKLTNIKTFELILGKFVDFLYRYETLKNYTKTIEEKEIKLESNFNKIFMQDMRYQNISGFLTEIFNQNEYNVVSDSLVYFIKNHGNMIPKINYIVDKFYEIKSALKENYLTELEDNTTLKEIDTYFNIQGKNLLHIMSSINFSDDYVIKILKLRLGFYEFIDLYNRSVEFRGKIIDILNLYNIDYTYLKQNFDTFFDNIQYVKSFIEMSDFTHNQNHTLDTLKEVVRIINQEDLNITTQQKNLNDNLLILKKALDIDLNFTIEGDLEDFYINLKNIKSNIGFLNEISKINAERNSFLEKFNSMDFIDKISTNIDTIIELKGTAILSFYDFISNLAIQRNSNLISDTVKHKNLILDFKTMENSIIDTNSHFILNSFKEKFQKYKEKNEVYSLDIIERESKKQRKHIPIRKFLSDNATNIQKITPCWLASPNSISNFSPLGTCTFDYIIFDEASQIKVEQTLGPIARGNNLIVIGDSKQMPPSNFFNKTFLADGLDDDDDSDEYESILDSVNAVFGKMSTMLRYHYRSKYPELIEFSNNKMYKDSLITFPSNYINPRPIEFIYVEEGIFDGNRTENGQKLAGQRNNTKEAILVAEKCYEIAKIYPHKSIGVVTFNEKQEEEVRYYIEELSKKNEEYSKIKELLDEQSENPENFFIKNLETVQGDERDIILISVTYGKNKSGKLTQRFGPISTANGDRRLNVAVSRAKEKMIIFSSIKYTDITPGDSKANGFFQKFLEYAEKGTQALYASKTLDPDNKLKFDSPFEEHVWEELTNIGFTVDSQVGVLGYRIDLAIQNQEGTKYLLGIECDGRNYHSSYVAKTNDRVRQEILEKAGWDIFRIYSIDWFNNKDIVIDKIIKRCKLLSQKD